MLSLPARLHLRWLVILVVTTAVMGMYGRVLATSGPMPPSRAPAGAPSPTLSASPASTPPSEVG